MDMEKEQKDIDKAVDAEKKKEKDKIVNLNKHYLDIRHKEVKQAKLAEKEKQKIKNLQKDISKIKKEKPAMSKKKMNSVIDKALSKMTQKEKKQEAKKMAAQKKKLLVPKHIPYKFQPIDIPKERPKWLPTWMWQEFKNQN